MGSKHRAYGLNTVEGTENVNVKKKHLQVVKPTGQGHCFSPLSPSSLCLTVARNRLTNGTSH